ncbi:hypothetical protein, partial [Escherichia coli]|uniref:hypothetical protein n=1 Tax=Escherichia coli TaxID=562 RepID=UPI00215B421A
LIFSTSEPCVHAWGVRRKISSLFADTELTSPGILSKVFSFGLETLSLKDRTCKPDEVSVQRS